MFKATARLASGEGTVAYHRDNGVYIVTVWTEQADRFIQVETFEFDGTLADEQAARAMARGYVASYAAAN